MAETRVDTSDLGDLAAYNESAGLPEDQGMDLSSYPHNVDLTLSDANPFSFEASNPGIPGQRHANKVTADLYSPFADRLNLPETSSLADNWLAECIREHDKEHDTGYLEGPAFHQRRVTQKNSVVYTYYPFLTLDNLFSCPPHDVDFLEAEGCFHLPTRKIMDQIVRQYFLHVHPLLPILNEGDFWEMYYNKRTNEPATMSLLVFQAMMFVSCNVSSDKWHSRHAIDNNRYSNTDCYWGSLSTGHRKARNQSAIRAYEASGPHFIGEPRCVAPGPGPISPRNTNPKDSASLRLWHRVITSGNCASRAPPFLLDTTNQDRVEIQHRVAQHRSRKRQKCRCTLLCHAACTPATRFRGGACQV